jgi:hypothetical protein
MLINFLFWNQHEPNFYERLGFIIFLLCDSVPLDLNVPSDQGQAPDFEVSRWTVFLPQQFVDVSVISIVVNNDILVIQNTSWNESEDLRYGKRVWTVLEKEVISYIFIMFT